MPDLMISKVYFALLSLIGFLLSVVVLRLVRPDVTARLYVLSVSALILCAAVWYCGDMFSTELLPTATVPFLKEMGWFALGTLFGIGRGDVIVHWLDKRDEKTQNTSNAADESEKP